MFDSNDIKYLFDGDAFNWFLVWCLIMSIIALRMWFSASHITSLIIKTLEL